MSVSPDDPEVRARYLRYVEGTHMHNESRWRAYQAAWERGVAGLVKPTTTRIQSFDDWFKRKYLRNRADLPPLR